MMIRLSVWLSIRISSKFQVATGVLLKLMEKHKYFVLHYYFEDDVYTLLSFSVIFV